MSQTFTRMLEKVEEFHRKHDFANKENNGHDMSYRILLTIEELGELAECFTKGKSKDEKAEELADILILIFGHSHILKIIYDKKTILSEVSNLEFSIPNSSTPLTERFSFPLSETPSFADSPCLSTYPSTVTISVVDLNVNVVTPTFDSTINVP